jgi:hypothetical protein
MGIDIRLLPGLLTLALAAGCAAKAAPPPPPTPASDAVRIARIVRLMELNRNRVALELERVSMAQRYGERHPEMLRVTSQLQAVDAAIKREFLPDEQAAIAAYDDKATALRLQLQEELLKGRGENHPAVMSIRHQIATLEQMASEARGPQTEAALLARIQQDPQAPAPQIELALHYLRQGRNADAERALERAMKLLRRSRQHP